MELHSACKNILFQLADFVEQIDSRDFVKPSNTLNQSTVGQHLRHTLEFFVCLEKGFRDGKVNYDKRSHDKFLENDKNVALITINRIVDFVTSIDLNRSLKLEVTYDLNSSDCAVMETNAAREIVYNIEHAVHHMAIIKIGLKEVAPYVSLPSDFGIAASTIRYQNDLIGEKVG